MKYILSLILLFAFTNAVQTQTINQWDIQNVTGSTLKFKNGKTFNTHLYQLKYIGQISNGTNAPFFIFSGRDCDDCDENISIYIHSPANVKISIERGQNRYEYPGNEKDYEKNTLVSKSSAYYGQVLKNTIGYMVQK